MNNLWLICSKCGFNASIPQDQLKEWQSCPNCQGKLVLDISQGQRTDRTDLGDNFPAISKEIIKEEKQTINKSAYMEFAEIEQINKAIPIISRKDILEFVIDINLIYWEKLLKENIC